MVIVFIYLFSQPRESRLTHLYGLRRLLQPFGLWEQTFLPVSFLYTTCWEVLFHSNNTIFTAMFARVFGRLREVPEKNLNLFHVARAAPRPFPLPRFDVSIIQISMFPTFAVLFPAASTRPLLPEL